MIDFLNWCGGKNLPLPTNENTKRAGVSQEYPDGYVRSQYPADAYFAPYSATAYLDLKNAKKVKNVKG
jgi:hypothetical protein